MAHSLPHNIPILIVGGGASGYFAALQAAESVPGHQIHIVEKGSQVLTKVRISGGGRCNVTHACFEPRELASHYPRGQKELLGPFHQWQSSDTVSWFMDRGIALKTEPDGRMFPVTDLSSTIVDCLENEARSKGIVVHTQKEVVNLMPADSGHWQVQFKDDGTIRAHQCLWAGGGMQSRQVIRMMEAIGHQVIPPIPSLFTFQVNDRLIEGLQGLSIEDVSSHLPWCDIRSQGPLLLTHWGLSGPAILKLSSWAAREIHDREGPFHCHIHWIPWVRQPSENLKHYAGTHGKKHVSNAVPFRLPKRLWHRMLERCKVPANTPWNQLGPRMLEALVDCLTHTVFKVDGKSRHKEEFVTCGGIDLRDVQPKTMESRQTPGLYFAGEALNVDAETGGFNFQAAWTTGHLAGSALARRWLAEHR